jgi:hypothetical protein
MTLMTRQLLTIYLHVKCHKPQAVSVLYQISLLEPLLLHDFDSKLGISEAGSQKRLQKSYHSSIIPLLLFFCVPTPILPPNPKAAINLHSSSL